VDKAIARRLGFVEGLVWGRNRVALEKWCGVGGEENIDSHALLLAFDAEIKKYKAQQSREEE